MISKSNKDIKNSLMRTHIVREHCCLLWLRIYTQKSFSYVVYWCSEALTQRPGISPEDIHVAVTCNISDSKDISFPPTQANKANPVPWDIV